MRKNKIKSVVLILALFMGMFPLNTENAFSKTYSVEKEGSFYSSDPKAAAILDSWFDIWEEGNRYPYRSYSYDTNQYGDAQCMAYSRDFMRAMAGNKGTKVVNVGTFTKKNVIKKCVGVPPGTFMSINRWHAVTLLKVTKKEIWWTDCNWDWKNTIHYYHDTVSNFMKMYSKGAGGTCYIEKPKGYTTKLPSARTVTLTFNANGGTGSMKGINLKYGEKFTFPAATFKRPNDRVAGWTIYRPRDKKWIYSKGSEWRWYTSKGAPSGWKKKVFGARSKAFAEFSYINGDKVIAYAKWEEAPKESKIWKRVYGSNRYSTMSEIVDEGFNETGGTIVVASGETYKDSLSASGLAGIYEAPLIITKGKSLSNEAKKQIVRLKPSQIFLVGGKNAVSESVLDSIEKASGVKPKRISGSTSAGTSAAIAIAAKGKWSNDKVAIIATNSGYKDALSAAPIAYAKKYPMLLASNGKSLSQSVKNALKTLRITEVIIVGGKSAVSENVEKQLSKMGIKIKIRLGGKNAASTSRLIARWGIKNGMNANNMGIATGQSYADALSGAALCGKLNSVLLLASDQSTSNTSFPKSYKKNIRKGYVFGGESAVGVKTWNLLVDATA